LVLTVALFGSLQLSAIAVVGEYVIKILEEAKRRPASSAMIRQGSACLTTRRRFDRFQRARRREAAARLRTAARRPRERSNPMELSRVLITGTTSGVGRALLDHYARRGEPRRREPPPLPELEARYPSVRFERVDSATPTGCGGSSSASWRPGRCRTSSC
jgi:hypothetical protein